MSEEGQACTETGCDGTLEVEDVSENCSCHINPPCQACVEAPLTCNICGEQQ